MSRTKHARRHAHEWKWSGEKIKAGRVVATYYRCAREGCFARKKDTRREK